ncbi:hypothetical protein Tco_0756818 [Tanacetum coccineum]
MAQDNGYAFVEVQEDGTKTICIDCWFEAQPDPKPDREAMWVHCQMHHSRMGHTITNRGLAATGTTGLVVGQCLGRGNTTIPVRVYYLISLGVRSTTAAGLAGGSVATGNIAVPEVIDDCMSPQHTASGKFETEPPATDGTRSPTSKSLTKSLFICDFVSLDSRLRSKKSAMDNSFTLGSTEEAENVKILQSCNGLLLCSGSGRLVFDYVYNPSTNQFKRLPHPNCSLDNSPYYRSAGLRMAFDPIKSPHYKLVDAGCTSCDIDIQIYSSETDNWSLCKDHFNYFSFDHFDSAIYWNDALHWLKTENRKLTHYRLDIEDHEHPIITTIQIPQRGMNFLQSYGYMDPMQILMQIPHLLYLEGNLFQSCGCFLLVCRDDIGSKREKDSLLVINLSGKVVQYNLISKTLHDIFYCGSNQLDDNHDDDDDNDDELLQQLEVEHNVYEFILSFARATWVYKSQNELGCFVIAAFLKLDPALPLYIILCSSEHKASYHRTISDGIVAFFAFTELDICLPSKALFFPLVDLDHGLPLEAFFVPK